MKFEENLSGKLEPNLSLRLSTPKGFRLSQEILRRWEDQIAVSVKKEFAGKFGVASRDVELNLTVSTGSVEITVAVVIGTIWIFLTQYDDAREGTVSFWNDVRSVWENVSRSVRKIVSKTLPKTRVISR